MNIVLPDGAPPQEELDVGDAATVVDVVPDAPEVTPPPLPDAPADIDAPEATPPDAPVEPPPPPPPLPDAPAVVPPPLPDAPLPPPPPPDGPIVVVPPPPPDAPLPPPPPPDAPVVVITLPDAPPVATSEPDAPPVVVIGEPDAPPAPAPIVTYTTANGLANPIVDVSTDEAGNVWAISPDTLFLLTPGAQTFRAFGNADGLHVEAFTGPDGSAMVTRLTAVAGASPNRLYLGYLGYESNDPYSDTDEQKRLGNGDRIDYDPATGTLSVNRYQFKCVVEVNRCWEDRSVRRIVVAHSGAAAGHAFFGFNHGTTHVWNDLLGDHVHPEIDWVDDTVTPPAVVTKYGECQALAVNDDGTLWIGNGYGVGLMNWNPDPIAWTTAKFRLAFTTFTDDHALEVPWGYTESNRAAAVSPDGTLWLASGTRGLTSLQPAAGYGSMVHYDSLPATLNDVVADLDGTLWIVVQGGTLLHYDPTTGTATPTGIADARRLYLDKTVTPRALYIARGSGVTVLRN